MALHISGMAAAIVDSKKVLFAETYGNCNSIDTPFNQRVSKLFWASDCRGSRTIPMNIHGLQFRQVI